MTIALTGGKVRTDLTSLGLVFNELVDAVVRIVDCRIEDDGWDQLVRFANNRGQCRCEPFRIREPFTLQKQPAHAGVRMVNRNPGRCSPISCFALAALAVLTGCSPSAAAKPSATVTPWTTATLVRPTPSVQSATPSVASPSPSPSPTAGWNVYTNTEFDFSISYAPGFVVENPLAPGLTLPPGWLLEMRAVETRFLGKIPPGQVEFGVRANDAETLTAWVQKHTGPCGSPVSKEYYWDNVSGVTPVKVAGRDALSFDWDQQACGTPYTIHLTAFVLRASYVFLFGWWAQDAAYGAALKSIADQMLTSFSG